MYSYKISLFAILSLAICAALALFGYQQINATRQRQPILPQQTEAKKISMAKKETRRVVEDEALHKLLRKISLCR